MIFSSHIFLLYFLPLFLVVYFLVPSKGRNLVLLLASIVFYAWGAPDFILILLASTVANCYLVKAMHRTDRPAAKRLLCASAILISLGLLAYFKYANFFVDNANALLSALGLGTMTWTKVLLPIGISFFTFQSITYVVDTYRGVNTPMQRLTDYVVYIIMFPQLIAGPIVRYTDIADQITARRRLRWDECLQGFYRFVIGLSKKVLIADVIGRTVDVALGGDLAAMDTGTAWVTITAYTMQLYFDFSGYSDMAIGLGRIMGFRFPENFDNPYNSASITEFWRRWHITLGAFMRNYLYIPLGGNRHGTARTYFNLWVVFLLSGLWHGASWNFVLWGAYHGFFLVVERILSRHIPLFDTKRRHPLFVLPTFIILLVGWAIFRIEDLPSCWLFIQRLFAFDKPIFNSQCSIFNSQFYVTLVVALLFAFCKLFFNSQFSILNSHYSPKAHIPVWLVACLLFFFCLGALTATDFSPFIYFRF
ncbi:MAG: MBOAT family protein [Bacteroidales bacterium]|nr:MBOAT family protein [Bacteroidales bacterium]